MPILTRAESVVKSTANPFETNRRVLASDLSLASKAVFLVILDHARHGKRTCWASGRTIAREAGVSERRVSAITKDLAMRGLIRIERETGSKHSRRTIYIVIDDGGVSRMSYAEYLKTEHWQRTRARIMAADRHRCRICNSPNTLNVHHRTYERLGSERDDDLITLCRDCHAKFHDKLPA